MSKVFIWTGYFRDQSDFDQYVKLMDEPFDQEILEEDDEDEAAMSFFCEDIDLPVYDKNFQKLRFFDTENQMNLLEDFVGKSVDLQSLQAIVSRSNYPTYNAIVLITAHEHTRFYRGSARPGSPVHFVGCFDNS